MSATSAWGALDFTPIAQEVAFEGVRERLPGFSDGGRIVTFSPPSGWSLEGSGDVLKLSPKENQSAARIETRPLSIEAVGSPGCLEKCQLALIASLSRQAEDLQWEPVEMNPVLLNRHESIRLELRYKIVGQSYRATMIVCNLADQQLRFLLTSRDKDFPQLFENFRRSLFTWQGLR